MTPLYLHGLPGSGAELALGPVDWSVLERDAPSFAQLALRLPDGPLHLIGFSLGAACAVRLAALCPERVAQVTLISAAAPLELGDFLPDMAGAGVFRAARSKAQLSALTRVQSTLARISPMLFQKMLSKGTDDGDKALFQSPKTGPLLRHALQEGLTRNKAVYLRELAAYVRPWANHLDHVRAAVTLIHGDKDQWAPAAMSTALADRLPRSDLIHLPDLGHYATLRHVLQNGV